MRKVYAVNSGSYSSYRVNAIFSSKKLAEKFMCSVRHDDYNKIDEYELDPPTADLISRGYSVWNVHMLIDGTTERVDRTENDLYAVEDGERVSIWERTKAPAYKGKNIPDILTAAVWAKTEKQAVKIVNEKRAQFIALGRWK